MMKKECSKGFISQKATEILWIIMIATLPITSMPLVARLLGSNTVAAPAIIFVFFLTILWFIPYLFKRGRLVEESIPLLIFVIIALVSTLLANFRMIPPYKDVNYFSNSAEAFVTLLIGVMFFLIPSSYVDNEKKALLTLKVINWSGLVMFVWTSLQAVAWYGFGHYPNWMFDLQGLISSRVLYRQRVNGMALEPSWFAHELNMVYLPIWLAATIKGISAFKQRLGFFSIENILLVAGVGSLLLTFSRSGLVSFLLMFTFLFIQLHTHLVSKVSTFFQNKNKENDGKGKKYLKPLISFAIILLYGLIIVAGLFIFSLVDPRMKSLFDFSVGSDNPLLAYFNELSFGERVIYWLAGWNIFSAHPFFGVGLGNAGFYFPQAITPYGWTLIEVRRLIYRTSILLNVKSLWVRLLAETGLVGFAVFCSWLVMLGKKFIKKAEMEKNMQSLFALAGIFMLCALITEGFSIDSFAMPYLWITLGFATADFAS